MDEPKGSETQIMLRPSAPHTVRVLDDNGNPVVGEIIRANVRVENVWMITRSIPESHVKTDSNGDAVFPWFPATGVKYVDVEFNGTNWKKDETDAEKTSVGLTVIHARRRHWVSGRVVAPKNANVEGLLITGFAFGPGHTGILPYARTRLDGTITVEFDQETISLLLIDRKQQFSGFVTVGKNESSVDLPIQSMAKSFSGTLVDEHDQTPLCV